MVIIPSPVLIPKFYKQHLKYRYSMYVKFCLVWLLIQRRGRRGFHIVHNSFRYILILLLYIMDIFLVLNTVIYWGRGTTHLQPYLATFFTFGLQIFGQLYFWARDILYQRQLRQRCFLPYPPYQKSNNDADFNIVIRMYHRRTWIIKILFFLMCAGGNMQICAKEFFGSHVFISQPIHV